MSLQQMGFGLSHICLEIVLGGIDREGLFCQSPGEFMWSFSSSHRKVKVFRHFKVVPLSICFLLLHINHYYVHGLMRDKFLASEVSKVLGYCKPYFSIGFCL